MILLPKTGANIGRLVDVAA